MLLLDVNILIHAHRAESPEHPGINAFLKRLLDDAKPFGVPESALVSLVRIVTQPYWKPPSTLEQAIGFCEQLRSSPYCMVIQPSESHWSIFVQLCRRVGAKGKFVADAYLAAFAIDRDAEWVTTDRDFSHFPGLRWRHPLDDQARTNPR